MEKYNKLFQKVVGYAWIVALTCFPLLFAYVMGTFGSAFGAAVTACSAIYGLVWFTGHWRRYWKLRDEHERD